MLSALKVTSSFLCGVGWETSRLCGVGWGTTRLCGVGWGATCLPDLAVRGSFGNPLGLIAALRAVGPLGSP